MRSNESASEFATRRAKTTLLSLLLVVVAGCGGTALDTTNADAFERTFDAMIAGLPQAEQEALASAILTVYTDAERERILPSALPRGRDVDALLDRRFRPALVREIIRSSGATLDGKTAGELLAMVEEITVKADRNQAIREQERREKQAARLREQIAELEDQLVGLREDVEDAEADRTKAQEEIRDDLAILDGVKVSLDGQRATLDGGILRTEMDLTFSNETRAVVEQVTHGYEWTYGECGGYVHVFLVQRLLERPLEPEASVSVVAPGGHGGFLLSITDPSGRTCPVTTASEYRVTAVNASKVTYGESRREVRRQDVDKRLSRLEAGVESRRARVVAMQERINEKVAALAAL